MALQSGEGDGSGASVWAGNMKVILTILGISVAQAVGVAWWLGSWQGEISTRIGLLEIEHREGRIVFPRLIALEQQYISMQESLKRIESKIDRWNGSPPLTQEPSHYGAPDAEENQIQPPV